MKAVNFWKTLFCAALAVTAFTACSDDDDNGYSGTPEISVNGAATVSVVRDLTAGETSPVVSVVSKGDWTLAFNNAGDSQWVTPSTMSGKTGTTTLTFNVAQASAARTAKLTLTASTTFEGIPLKATAEIVVMQNEGGSTDVETNVKEIRTKMAAIATDGGVTISEDLTLTGIVVSDVEAGGFAGNRNCVVVDNSTEAGAGIIVRFPASGYKFPVGQVITGSIKGAKAALSYGVLQIDLDGSTVSFSAVEGSTVDVQPIPVPAADLATYESQYVKVSDVQPVASARGGKFYQGTSSYTTTKFETKTGGSLDISIYKTNDWAKTAEVPAKSGYVCGLVSIYNGVGQVAPRNAKDVAGLTNDLFTEAGPVTSTIAGITEAGKYKVVDAIVAANYESGFVMEDATGQMLVYQFIKGATITIPAVGAKVTVTGTVEPKNGMLQFSPEGLTVDANGTGSVKPQTATVLDGAAVTALFNSPVMKYVKYTGKLTVDGNHYNVAIDGTEVVGSISYPNADLNVASFNGQTIDVEGWFIGATSAASGAKYLTTLAVKVSANASVPSVVFTNQPATFAAENPEQQTINYTANAAAGTVTFDITGTDAAKFKVVSNTNSQVVIKAEGNNTGTTPYTATLNAKGSNGTILATADLKQAAPTSGSGYAKIEKVADLKEGTGYLAGLVNGKYQTWTGALPSKQCETVPYSYTEATGAFVADDATGAEISLVAVSGVSNAYYIKYGEKYLTVAAAGKNQLALADSAGDNYWTFTDDTNGVKATAKAFASIMMTSTGASSKYIRSYVTTNTSGVAGVVFFLAK